jgi:transcriptional regulator with XRE-family HTH domain
VDTKALRKNLPELRIRRGLSQGDLGREAGVRADTVSSIERGKHVPRPSTLRKLADALGVEVEGLFREPEAPKAPTVPQSLDELRDFLKARLGSAWIALPDDEWKNWWRNVSMEEATKRYRQILAESKLIYDTWTSKEDVMALAKSGFHVLRFVRRLEAPYFAPQQNESEEEFQERSAKGLAIPSYYEPVFQEQRQDMEREAEEEEQRQLTAV